MENEEKKIVPVENEEQFDACDFEFVHHEKNDKIHDEEFKTKPTTFAKDALKRFVKNKASVVGAVIIGILLIGSFASMLSPYDVEAVYMDRVRLPPKVREASDGFWDGTVKYTRVYDPDTQFPVLEDENADDVSGEDALNADCVLADSIWLDPELHYYSEAVPHGKGGYYRLRADKTIEDGATSYFFNNFTSKKVKFDITQADDLKLSVTFGGEDGLFEDKLVPVNIWLCGLVDNDYGANDQITPILLGENLISPDGNDFTFNVDDIAAKMAAAGLNKIFYARIRFEFLASSKVSSYILVKNVKLTCADTSSDTLKQRLNEVSFDDPNWLARYTTPEKYTERYWQSSAQRLVHKVYTQQCTFLYDSYRAVFGMRNAFVVGKSIVQSYIDKGWCTMSDFDDISTFKLTNPDSLDCPLRSIESLQVYEGVYQYTGHVLYYRYLDLNGAPSYIFGTDAKGRDMVTLALSCLKNSLLLAIITSGICLAIGLVWGSVSGYFGGNVDLIMERITDILSGVPWIVVMTLAMLSLGRNYLTFGIAVCLTGWIGTSSRTRTQFYRFKGREYVLASRTLGASDGRLIFRHILPNGLGTIVTGSVLMIPSTIFSEATLSYLGLGLQGTASFGVVLSENQANLSSRPMLVIFPAIIVSLLMISFNLFGNGLRDALNPTLKGGEQ